MPTPAGSIVPGPFGPAGPILIFAVAGLMGVGSVSAQTEASPALDVVSIQDRPGFLEAFQQVVNGEEREGIAALTEILKAYETDPDSYILQYNVACGYARLGEIDKGLSWLDRAVRAGYGVQVRQVQNLAELDPDLAALRPTEGFKPILDFAVERSQRIQNNWEKMREAYVFVPEVEGEAKIPILLIFHPFGWDPVAFAQHYMEFAQAQGFALVAPTGGRLVAEKSWAWAASSADLNSHFRLDHREALLAVKKAQRRDPRLDSERLYTTGMGQGAALAFAFAVRNPQVVRGAAVFSGGYSPSTVEGWTEKCAELGRRIEISHGIENPFYPVEPLEAYVAELSEAGLKIRLNKFPGGHGLPRDLTERLRASVSWVDSETDSGGLPRDQGP